MFGSGRGARRVVSLVVVLSVFVGVGLVGVVGSALAVGSLPLQGFFPEREEGSGSGEFETPRGIAVDDSSGSSKGDVYVVDQGDFRVEKLDPFGNFLLMFGREVNETKDGEAGATEAEKNVCTAVSGNTCKAGVQGEGEGQFKNGLSGGGVAVDPASGGVYAVDRHNHRVQKFSPEGHFELMFGGDVNEGNGTNICKAGEKCKTGVAATSGEPQGEFYSWPEESSFIAVGHTGTIYVGDNERIQEFNGQGVYQTQVKLPGAGEVTALAVNEAGDLFFKAKGATGVREVEPSGVESFNLVHEYDAHSGTVASVAVDPVGANSHMYVVDSTPSLHVEEYETSGFYTELAESKSELLAESTGLGVSGGGTIYASNGSNGKVFIFGARPTSAPTVAVLPLAQDSNRSAQLQASITPHFQETKYYVQYGMDTSYEEGDVPTPPGYVLGGGSTNTAQTASVVLEGLRPGTEYHYRFVAESAAKETTYGPDETFVTDAEGITGLPDGRVYEQVSPPFKNGNFFDPITGFMMGLAEAGGDAVLYPMSGAIGGADAGIVGELVSRHLSGGGWSTSQTTPRPTSEIHVGDAPSFILPSSDFRRFLFGDEEPFSSEGAFGFKDAAAFANIFVGESAGDGPPEAALWVTRPRIADPVPVPGGVGKRAPIGPDQNYVVVGASPDLSRVYFGYAGTLLPQDAERAAHVGEGLSNGTEAKDPWGFYEWEDGVLREAGTLPDGKQNPFGAVPATSGQSVSSLGSRSENFEAGDFDNVVSENGDRTFFVSPDPDVSKMSDPEGCGEAEAECTSEAPQLYVREVSEGGGEKVSLVSASQVPGSVDDPAPHGAVGVNNPTYGAYGGATQGGATPTHGGATYAFASPDGSHVFFASDDRLTSAAPGTSELKEYEYDVDTGALTYLPGVEGEIGTVSGNGSEFLFVATREAPWKAAADPKEPQELELWREGPDGGTVTPVVALPDAIEVALPAGTILHKPTPEVRSVHVSTDGNVFVFSTDAPIDEPPDRAFNDRGLAGLEGNSGAHSALEVYRYEVSSGELDCLSCPPKGVRPVGDAYMSYNNFENMAGEEVPHENGGGDGYAPQTTQETRGTSANGEMVFFDTRSPLVSQATNGKRDVYEWEDGHVYLISSGIASENSYYLDNSESGGDVFFATAAGLVPNDTDGTYDIYDARIPRPGDTTPPVVPPCKGSVCQGPPSTPELLGAPPSETFSGPGNPVPTPEVKPAVTTKPKAKAKPKKKKKKNRKHSKGKSKKAKKSDRGRSR